jgi:hypothetical protein
MIYVVKAWKGGNPKPLWRAWIVVQVGPPCIYARSLERHGKGAVYLELEMDGLGNLEGSDCLPGSTMLPNSATPRLDGLGIAWYFIEWPGCLAWSGIDSEIVYHCASNSIAACPKLSSLTETGRRQSGQQIEPRDVKAVKIISSNVSPSPSANHGPSSIMRLSTSRAGVSGGAIKRWQQRWQNNSICMVFSVPDMGNETMTSG